MIESVSFWVLVGLPVWVAVIANILGAVIKALDSTRKGI